MDTINKNTIDKNLINVNLALALFVLLGVVISGWYGSYAYTKFQEKLDYACNLNKFVRDRMLEDNETIPIDLQSSITETCRPAEIDSAFPVINL